MSGLTLGLLLPISGRLTSLFTFSILTPHLALSDFPDPALQRHCTPLLLDGVAGSVAYVAGTCLQLCIRPCHHDLGCCGFSLLSLGGNSLGSDYVPSTGLWGHLGVFLLCPGVHFVPSLGCLAEPTELGAHRTGVQSPQLCAGLLVPVDVSVCLKA